MLYVHLLLLDPQRQNERNGSLIDGSDLAADDPLKSVLEGLATFYKETFTRRLISAKVKELADAHQEAFADRAMFWYTLAVGIEIADPRSYGRAANPYFAKAQALDSELHLAYCHYLHQELTRRHEADISKMAPALSSLYWIPLMRAERQITALESKMATTV